MKSMAKEVSCEFSGSISSIDKYIKNKFNLCETGYFEPRKGNYERSTTNRQINERP